jgi:hypothetical protein
MPKEGASHGIGGEYLIDSIFGLEKFRPEQFRVLF